MDIKDLLDIDKVNELEKKVLAISKKPITKEAFKKTRTLAKLKSGIKDYKPDLGSEHRKALSRWRRKMKSQLKGIKGQKKGRSKVINRKYENRCPKRYEVYILSKWWEERKNDYYKVYGYKCELCGKANRIHLHHIWYGEHGKESDQQLIALCQKHHKEFHDIYGRGTGDFRKQTREFLEKYGNPLNRIVPDKQPKNALPL